MSILAKNDPVRTAKEQRFIDLMLQGKTRYAAALEAGFTKNQAHAAYRILARVQIPLREAIERSIPKDLIAKRLVEGLDAEKTVLSEYKGKFTDSKTLTDMRERREYAKLISQITGDLSQEAIAMSFNFTVPPLITTSSSTVREPGDNIVIVDAPTLPSGETGKDGKE